MMKSDRSKPLGADGLDSLITIEVRNWIFREIQAGLQIMELLLAKPLVELAGLILKQSRIISAALKSRRALSWRVKALFRRGKMFVEYLILFVQYIWGVNFLSIHLFITNSASF